MICRICVQYYVDSPSFEISPMVIFETPMANPNCQLANLKSQRGKSMILYLLEINWFAKCNTKFGGHPTSDCVPVL
jgi:hypothetical protein